MDFRDLKVWQRARELCVGVYRCTEGFPPKERFGLTSQIREAAVPVCTNIAEGFGRGAGRDFAYHPRIARGSANEVRCCAIVAADLGFLPADRLARLDGPAVEVCKMLTALLRKVGGLV